MNLNIRGNILLKHKKLPDCEFCNKAEELLKERKMSYTTILSDKIFFGDFYKQTGNSSVPQLIINGKHLGDFDTLTKYLKEIDEGSKY